jgi:hypothetical protein
MSEGLFLAKRRSQDWLRRESADREGTQNKKAAEQSLHRLFLLR